MLEGLHELPFFGVYPEKLFRQEAAPLEQELEAVQLKIIGLLPDEMQLPVILRQLHLVTPEIVQDVREKLGGPVDEVASLRQDTRVRTHQHRRTRYTITP